uniref:Uncharacterized protein n=1 Tax=Megaselia scalaris TaxID=36166 RepID=T1GTM1_MEGSC
MEHQHNINDCKNYRGVSLISVAYKTLAYILSERLKPHVIRIAGPYNIDPHHLFIDFRQSYDTHTRALQNSSNSAK